MPRRWLLELVRAFLLEPEASVLLPFLCSAHSYGITALAALKWVRACGLPPLPVETDRQQPHKSCPVHLTPALGAQEWAERDSDYQLNHILVLGWVPSGG